MKLAVAGALLFALALPPAAAAHATLVRSEPASGATLATAPRVVTLVFDDTVHAGPGVAAVRNGDGSVLGGSARTNGRTETVPLRPGLKDGVYTVRWSVVSDDGHLVEGVVPFRVGSGGPVEAALSAGGPDRTADVAARWAYLLGVLLAGGTAVFVLAVGRTPEKRRLLAAGFALTVVGATASLLLQATTATRYAHVQEVAIGTAAAGLVLLRTPAALLAALALLALPTLGGHALDPGRSWVEVPIDLVHVVAAATWLGGLASLAFALALVRRFSRVALVAVLALAVTGPLRALSELSAVHQLWTTGYGRALLVKTGLFGILVVLGYANRGRLSRRRVVIEIALLTVLVAAVGFLTDSRPGRRAAAAPPVTAGPAPLPPRDALVLAREDGPWAVALAVRARELTTTVLGQDGNGVDGLAASVDGVPATACGHGCYRATVPRVPPEIAVRLGRTALRFDVPADTPPAAAVARRATRAFRSLRSVAFTERLASGAGASITTRWVEQAPDRLAYRIRGGPEAVVIGARRWDRLPGGSWVASQTQRLPFPAPPWTEISNARLVASTPRTRTVAFLDRSIPAWFEVVVDRRSGRPLAARMTATAHFMRHAYGSFDSAPPVRAPGGAR